MPIKIIRDDERLVCEINGSKFYYRRANLRLQTELLREYPDYASGGDVYKVALKTLKLCLLDWEDVFDGDQPVRYDKSLIPCLPVNVVNELFIKVMEGQANISDRGNEELKN